METIKISCHADKLPVSWGWGVGGRHAQVVGDYLMVNPTPQYRSGELNFPRPFFLARHTLSSRAIVAKRGYLADTLDLDSSVAWTKMVRVYWQKKIPAAQIKAMQETGQFYIEIDPGNMTDMIEAISVGRDMPRIAQPTLTEILFYDAASTPVAYTNHVLAALQKATHHRIDFEIDTMNARE